MNRTVFNRTLSRLLQVSVTALALSTGACLPLAAAARPTARTVAVARTVVIYSVTTRERFINHADDRRRGDNHNPLGTFDDPSLNATPDGSVPQPGDAVMFAFRLFNDPGLKTAIGRATITCQYGFDRTAFCDASYHLQGGELVVAGSFGFDTPAFTLAVVGGTGAYRDVTGAMNAAPAVRHTQRLEFHLSQSAATL